MVNQLSDADDFEAGHSQLTNLAPTVGSRIDGPFAAEGTIVIVHDLGKEKSRHAEALASRFTQPDVMQISDWRTAELNAAKWMQYWGWPDAKVTDAGPDAGIDVRAHSAIAQVKYEARQVGRPVLHQLVGARPRGRDDVALLFFTGAGYSRTALDYANERDIALFHYNLDGTMQAVNGAAESVLFSAPAFNKTAALVKIDQDIKHRYANALEMLKTLLAAAPRTELFEDCRINDYGTRGASYIVVVNDPIVTLIGVGYDSQSASHVVRLTEVFGFHSFATHDSDVPDNYGMAVGPPLHTPTQEVWDNVEHHIRSFAQKYLRDKALGGGLKHPE